uniref:Uncharacterized protein n=1 Tax=Gloeothece verrucosa (strain PCC 7822) TaxID=497965 RepID=E0UC05_GLOV7|nr:hypothetical protein Cyan7822_4429 [Gloeothece verrucosa PCC 7822]
MIDHALICYAEKGKACYQQIKDHGGRETIYQEDDKFYEKYEDVFVETLPPIVELVGDSNETPSSQLKLPMSVLTPVPQYIGGTLH